MAVVRDDHLTHRTGPDGEPVLETEDARQADNKKESFRILDVSLPLAVLALALVGIYIAAVATN